MFVKVDRMDHLFVSSKIFQARVDGVQEEDFRVDFPSLLPDHPAFLYALAGLGELLVSASTEYKKMKGESLPRLLVSMQWFFRWFSWSFSPPNCMVEFYHSSWQKV